MNPQNRNPERVGMANNVKGTIIRTRRPRKNIEKRIKRRKFIKGVGAFAKPLVLNTDLTDLIERDGS